MRPSTWVRYEGERQHYTDEALEAKRDFVRKSVSDPRVRTVLDLGCNAGEFSLIAESCGRQVVAADNDEQALEALSVRVRERRSTVQPLYFDIGRPTPAVGWMGAETPGVLERMAGQFDCVLMLGLIHHVLISERAPLARICELLYRLRPRVLVVEWVDREDPRFQGLAGINSALYANLDKRSFEAEIARYFAVTEAEPLATGTRTLFRCELRELGDRSS
ncbi:MAG: class I SAM-dependent methyltransferase [Gammaproteobacteria bacterium]